MSSISWEAYLTETITNFRKEFEKFSIEDQKRIMQKEFDDLPFEPCQIEVLDFGANQNIIFFLIHDKKLPDMMFKIHKEAKNIEESEFKKKYKFAMLQFPTFDESGWKKIFPTYRFFIYTKASLNFNPMMSPLELVRYFMNEARRVLKDEQVDVIKRSTDGLKKSISKVPESDIRRELLASTNKIDKSLLEIRRLDEEIGKVRQLVGATKEIQDWRALISDVDRLKGEHVSREVFDAKVNELHTRIDSLTEIKEAYDKVLEQQNEFMKQQAEVMKQQSSFVTWIKYATILVPIAVVLVPIIDALIRHFLGIP